MRRDFVKSLSSGEVIKRDRTMITVARTTGPKCPVFPGSLTSPCQVTCRSGVHEFQSG